MMKLIVLDESQLPNINILNEEFILADKTISENKNQIIKTFEEENKYFKTNPINIGNQELKKITDMTDQALELLIKFKNIDKNHIENIFQELLNQFNTDKKEKNLFKRLFQKETKPNLRDFLISSKDDLVKNIETLYIEVKKFQSEINVYNEKLKKMHKEINENYIILRNHVVVLEYINQIENDNMIFEKINAINVALENGKMILIQLILTMESNNGLYNHLKDNFLVLLPTLKETVIIATEYKKNDVKVKSMEKYSYQIENQVGNEEELEKVNNVLDQIKIELSEMSQFKVF